jgi:hypothetical protein
MKGKIAVKTQAGGEFEITVLIPTGDSLINQLQETTTESTNRSTLKELSIS